MVIGVVSVVPKSKCTNGVVVEAVLAAFTRARLRVVRAARGVAARAAFTCSFLLSAALISLASFALTAAASYEQPFGSADVSALAFSAATWAGFLAQPACASETM